MRRLVLAMLALALLGFTTAAAAQETALPAEHWSFQGIFGIFDRAALRRGFQVYKEVCSACHSMSQLHYRDLAGIGFSQEEIKAIAASVQVPDVPDDNGEIKDRPGRPSDIFKPPFPNEQAARAANNGALPPDLSLMALARKGGADYIYAILIGYSEPPADVTLQAGMNYNKFFPGHQIAMPQPISDGTVTYADGTKATTEQEARDVANFLSWAAEPELEERHFIGIKTILYLIVFTAILYALKRKVWAAVH